MSSLPGSTPPQPDGRGALGTSRPSAASGTAALSGTSSAHPGMAGPTATSAATGPSDAGWHPGVHDDDALHRGRGGTERSEFGAFLDDLSELARGAGAHGDLRDELERRVSQARTRMDAALDHGREMSMRARDQVQRGLEVSRDAVGERPLSYVALAAVGGLLIGLLISRRD